MGNIPSIFQISKNGWKVNADGKRHCRWVPPLQGRRGNVLRKKGGGEKALQSSNIAEENHGARLCYRAQRHRGRKVNRAYAFGRMEDRNQGSENSRGDTVRAGRKTMNKRQGERACSLRVGNEGEKSKEVKTPTMTKIKTWRARTEFQEKGEKLSLSHARLCKRE